MNIYTYLYLASILFCLGCNIRIYERFEKAEGHEKFRCLWALISLVFLGPISILINLYYLGIFLSYKVHKYLYYKKIEQSLCTSIEESLFKALEENDIKVVDK